MQQNRIIESSNMLHYSNASSREKNRRYLVIKGGACLEALQTKGIFGSVTVVEHRSIKGLGVYHSIGVYRKEATKGKQINNSANNSITKHNMAKGGATCDLTR